MGKVGSLGNNTVTTRVGEFGGILRYSFIYPKFGHLENTLMGGMENLLVEELSI